MNCSIHKPSDLLLNSSNTNANLDIKRYVEYIANRQPNRNLQCVLTLRLHLTWWLATCDQCYIGFISNVLTAPGSKLSINRLNKFELSENPITTKKKCWVEEKGKSNSWSGLDRPWGFQEVEVPRFQDNWHMTVVRLSALGTGRLYPPGNIPGAHFW